MAVLQDAEVSIVGDGEWPVGLPREPKSAFIGRQGDKEAHIRAFPKSASLDIAA